MSPKELRSMVREVNKLVPYVSPLSQEAYQYAQEHVFPQEICLCKGKAWCTACGGLFGLSKEDIKSGTYVCPKCGKKLNARSTTKSKVYDWGVFSVIDVVSVYQVIRHFKIFKSVSRTTPLRYYYEEVAQNWIDERGNAVTARKSWAMCGARSFSFVYNSQLKVRIDDYLGYNIWRIRSMEIYANVIYPKMKVLPILKRNGFRHSFHGITPCDVFRELLRSNNSEMLWKTKQYDILRYKIKKGWKCDTDYPKSVRIANRNRYYVKDASMWFDYLGLLSFFDKDLTNAYYVCPKNLKKEHDRLLKKQTRILEQRKLEEQKKEIEQAERVYSQHIARFKKLFLSDGLVKIRIIPSVHDVMEEGEYMHHCVFSGNYYNKKDTLLLSAKVNNERKETIEVNLTTCNIVQSRGRCNQNSEYHERIIKLLKREMYKIRELA